jgi:voltage-gated potassium channel
LQDLTNFQIYTAAFYFTVTTITTTGYGDLSATNTLERYMAVLLMVIGVVIFSIVRGAIT